MRILGIDPGIGRTGWAIIDKHSNQRIDAIDYGIIETDLKFPAEKRIEQIYDRFINIVMDSDPDCLAIEELFFGSNSKTALNVGQARGAILLAASKKNLSVNVYTPLQVKIAITGYGRAEKKQIEEMVKRLLNLNVKFKYDDISDALAIALAHAYTIKS